MGLAIPVGPFRIPVAVLRNLRIYGGFRISRGCATVAEARVLIDAQIRKEGQRVSRTNAQRTPDGRTVRLECCGAAGLIVLGDCRRVGR
jgi:hypothetical protein